MIALLKNWAHRKIVDAEIRRYKHNLAVLEKQMRDDAKMAQIVRGYLALSIAETKSDRYLGTEISDQTYRSSVWQALVWSYLALGVVGAVIFWFV